MVDRLQCVRGISTLTAFGLPVEIGDWPGARWVDQDRQQRRVSAADPGGL